MVRFERIFVLYNLKIILKKMSKNVSFTTKELIKNYNKKKNRKHK